MKKASDPRHLKRRDLVRELFAYSFTKKNKVSEATKQILAKTQVIDPLIEKCAPDWPLEKLNQVDLAILRLAVFELLQDKEPVKVIIDEAVELAKEFGSEGSPSFVNGVLGSIIKEKGENGQARKQS